MQLQVVSPGATERIDFAAETLVIAGWTGRDSIQVEQHIAELERIGVARPTAVPSFYRLGANLLTTTPRIEVVGGDSSGEVECVLFAATELLVGLGSDHTDRKLETHCVAQSKQVCPKPVGERVWRLADVEAHWDQLELRSFATRSRERRLYQSGKVSRMLHPRDLMRRFASDSRLPRGAVMFCGTLAVEGDIGPSEQFELELHDPVLQRSLRHAYHVQTLPLVR